MSVAHEGDSNAEHILKAGDPGISRPGSAPDPAPSALPDPVGRPRRDIYPDRYPRDCVSRARFTLATATVVVASMLVSTPSWSDFVVAWSAAASERHPSYPSLARPKSRTFALPRVVMKMFAGVMSRCTMISAPGPACQTEARTGALAPRAKGGQSSRPHTSEFLPSATVTFGGIGADPVGQKKWRRLRESR